jgi:hypothetical protein
MSHGGKAVGVANDESALEETTRTSIDGPWYLRHWRF